MFESLLSNGDAWLHYPLINLGDSSITVLMILKLIFWLAFVLLLNATVRWLIVDRLLAKTRFDLSLRFAVSRMATCSSCWASTSPCSLTG